MTKNQAERRDMPDRWLTVTEAAAYLHVSHKYVLKLTAAGQLRAARLGHNTVRFRKQDLEAWMTKTDPDDATSVTDPDEWWDAHTAAWFMQISSEQVRRHYRSGLLPGTRVGSRSIRFRSGDVRAFVEARAVESRGNSDVSATNAPQPDEEGGAVDPQGEPAALVIGQPS